MICLPLIAEQNAHETCLIQECLQNVRRLLWKQTTTHSIRNNNPMFDSQPPTQFFLGDEVMLGMDLRPLARIVSSCKLLLLKSIPKANQGSNLLVT